MSDHPPGEMYAGPPVAQCEGAAQPNPTGDGSERGALAVRFHQLVCGQDQTDHVYGCFARENRVAILAALSSPAAQVPAEDADMVEFVRKDPETAAWAIRTYSRQILALSDALNERPPASAAAEGVPQGWRDGIEAAAKISDARAEHARRSAEQRVLAGEARECLLALAASHDATAKLVRDLAAPPAPVQEGSERDAFLVSIDQARTAYKIVCDFTPYPDDLLACLDVAGFVIAARAAQPHPPADRVREALANIVAFCDDPKGSEKPETLALGLARLLPPARAALHSPAQPNRETLARALADVMAPAQGNRVMDRAQRATETVGGWSDAKQDYAGRLSAAQGGEGERT